MRGEMVFPCQQSVKDESFMASNGWGGIDARKVRAKHTDAKRIHVEVVMLFAETVEDLKASSSAHLVYRTAKPVPFGYCRTP